MAKLLTLFLFSVCALVVCIQAGTHEHLAANYHLEWDVVNNNTMTFNIESNNTKGYIGFGINTEGSMKNASLVFVGKENDSSTPYIHVYKATSNGPPTENLGPNHTWNMTNFIENATSVSFTLSRPVTSSNANHNNLTANGKGFVLWSLGNDDNISQHSNRGYKEIQFLKSSPSSGSEFQISTITLLFTSFVVGAFGKLK